MKKGKLSQLEQNQILEYIKDNKDLEKICTLMDRSKTVIEKFVQQNPTSTSTKSDRTSPIQLTNKTVGGKKGVFVMNQALSEHGDESRKKVKKELPNGAVKIFDE